MATLNTLINTFFPSTSICKFFQNQLMYTNLKKYNKKKNKKISLYTIKPLLCRQGNMRSIPGFPCSTKCLVCKKTLFWVGYWVISVWIKLLIGLNHSDGVLNLCEFVTAVRGRDCDESGHALSSGDCYTVDTEGTESLLTTATCPRLYQISACSSSLDTRAKALSKDDRVISYCWA